MLLRYSLVAVAGTALACSQSMGTDAGFDAGFDAGTDAGRDAGVDGGSDAAPDAGLDPGEFGWVRLSGLPDECAVVRAQHPERVWRPPEWEPCPGQPVGCRVARLGMIASDIGWYDPDTGRGFVYQYGSANVILDLDRGAVAAWRDPPRVAGDPWICTIHGVGIGDGYGAMYVNLRNFRADRGLVHVYHAPLDEIGQMDEPQTVLPDGLAATPQHLAVSRSAVMAEIQPVAVVVAFTADRWGSIWSDFLGIPQRVYAVGDYAFWLDFDRTPRIAFGSLDQSPTLLRDIAPGRIRAFGTDGTDLAWVEIRDSPPSFELWTAPVVFDAAELAPRRVREVTGIQFTGMGGGWFVLMKPDPQRLEIIDLESGRTKTWLPPPGSVVTITGTRPNYVTATEIVFDAYIAGAGTVWVRLDPRTIPWDDE